MSLNTLSNRCPAWPPWSADDAQLRRCAAAAIETVASFFARRAARRTLQELEHLDDRLLADIGIDRAELTSIMRGFARRT